MKPVAFASVVVRGIALWLLIEGVGGVTAVFQPWHQGRLLKRPEVLVLALRVCLPIATAAVVWVFADWLARRVVALEDEGAQGPSWTSTELLRVAIATVGLLTLVNAIPDLAWYASVLVALGWWRNTLLGPTSAPEAVANEYWNLSSKANLASTIVRAAIGLLFVLRPRSVASLVGRGDGQTTG